MTHLARHLGAAVTLLLLVPHQADAQGRVRIVITKPKLVRNVQAGQVDAIYNAVVREVKELFRCARVLCRGARAPSRDGIPRRIRTVLLTGRPLMGTINTIFALGSIFLSDK